MALLGSQRACFDIPREIAYFNCASNTPLLLKASERLIEGVRSKLHPWDRKPEDFFRDAEELRTMAARALGGSPASYAVIPSASYGTSMVSRILEDKLGKGDEIVVLSNAFPSNYLPWHRLSETTGATLAVAEVPDDHNWTQSVLAQITPKTKLVAAPNCHWTSGAHLNLREISIAAKSVGAVLVVDATQSLGAMPLDLAAIQPDFIVAAGYKWLLFPYGLSLFYADPKWHAERPLEETWLSRVNAEILENLVDYTPMYQPGARRYDMGQKNVPSLVPGGVVALRQLGNWGVANVAETLGALTDKIAGTLEEVGFSVIPKALRVPNILGASLPDKAADRLLPYLGSRQIFISRRGDFLRFAPHLHVDDHDLDRLFSALKQFSA